jgi:hypothetical protein
MVLKSGLFLTESKVVRKSIPIKKTKAPTDIVYVLKVETRTIGEILNREIATMAATVFS